MLFKSFVELLEEVSKTRSRLRIISLISSFFTQLTPEEARYTAYLLKGEVAPPYMGIEINVAEKTLLHVFSKLTHINVNEIEKQYKKLGDIGDLAYEIVKRKKTQALFTTQYTIKDVYNLLLRLSQLTGEGSQQHKENLLLNIFINLTPEEARYVARIIVGKTRIYVGVATILESISKASGYKKEEVERAYYLISDIGKVAEDALKGKLKAEVRLFYPISPALAERARNASQLHEKIPEAALEYKYDGFRVQIHKSKNKVKIYSRRLEDITKFLPDVVRYATEIPGEFIMEGESIGYDPKTNKYLPFQFTIRRKRKYDVQKYEKELPLHIYIFDILYLNGNEVLYLPFKERRQILENLIDNTHHFKPSHLIYSNHVEKTQAFFQEAISKGLEGIMAKKPDQPYTPGQRNHNWIKLKKDVIDTIDGVVVGFFYGQGKLKELPSSLLIALYNEEEDKFQTIAKVSSGLSEDEYKTLKELLKPVKEPPVNLEYHLEPDVWVEPEIVVELTYDDITISSIHTCDIGKRVALRFPRVIRIRNDKSINEVTTCNEIRELYEIAKK